MTVKDATKRSIESHLEKLGVNPGESVSYDSVTSVITSVSQSANTDLEEENKKLKKEIQEMVEFIAVAKSEIAAIQPRSISEQKIPDAADQLDAIVLATEEAADKIMDAAEQLGEVSETLDGEAGEKLMVVSTNLFEASSFQDICGQRIQKVTATLRYIEEKLQNLADTVDDQFLEQEKIVSFNKKGVVEDHASLLNGPQLESEDGNDQEDIDALLASFD